MAEEVIHDRQTNHPTLHRGPRRCADDCHLLHSVYGTVGSRGDGDVHHPRGRRDGARCGQPAAAESRQDLQQAARLGLCGYHADGLLRDAHHWSVQDRRHANAVLARQRMDGTGCAGRFAVLVDLPIRTRAAYGDDVRDACVLHRFGCFPRLPRQERRGNASTRYRFHRVAWTGICGLLADRLSAEDRVLGE